MKILALDFGGSSVKYGVIDENATLLTSGKRPAPLNSAHEFLDTAETVSYTHLDVYKRQGSEGMPRMRRSPFTVLGGAVVRKYRQEKNPCGSARGRSRQRPL